MIQQKQSFCFALRELKSYMEKLLDRPGNLFFTAFTALFCQKLGETHYFVRNGEKLNESMSQILWSHPKQVLTDTWTDHPVLTLFGENRNAIF